MNLKERYQAIIDWFTENMPNAKTELEYSNPFELIVAVMLSAQCTDKRVNMTTPKIFAKYPDAVSMAEATEDEMFHLIRSISYPNAKSKHLVEMAKILRDEFNSEVPSTMEQLQKLPGVGRKTANVVMGVAFNKQTMPVDTHVFRITHRIGLVPKSANTPEKTETVLVRHIPNEVLSVAHHWFILHGRYVCMARKPKCDECGIADYCKSAHTF